MPEPMHFLGARLKQCVELGAVFDDFPASFESGRHDEAFSRTEFPALTRGIFQRHPAPGEAAELRFRIADAPLAAGAGPDSAVELLRLIGKVVGDGLARRAGEQ